MAKSRSTYVCQSCGAQAAKWLGKCPDCGAWSSYVESIEPVTRVQGDRRLVPRDSAATHPLPLPAVDVHGSEHQPIGMPELDRVLGGGIVPSSLILLGGDPGIGKSTIVLQALAALAAHGKRSLYVTGEESAAQVRLRAERLGVQQADHLFLFAENALTPILAAIREFKPQVCVIDSIQTMYVEGLESSPGTVSQLREVATQLLYTTKSMPMATVLIGHVTKDGTLAGPRVLEHMVDTVLYFEGERSHQYRLLRAVKNRFGSTNEIGVFEMTERGLQEVSNPSALFLAERPHGAAGSVVVVPMEGTRPLLVELQALVTHSGLANPRRTVIGVESNRVNLLAAVLEKVVGVQLGDQDIFVNAAGGLRVAEPASDVGIVCALASSFYNRPIPHDTVVIGEVGLTGEVRGVSGLDARLQEAGKLGFAKAVIPASQAAAQKSHGLTMHPVTSVSQVLDLFVR